MEWVVVNEERKGKNYDDVRFAYSSSSSSSLPSLGKACRSSSTSSCFLFVRVVMIGVLIRYAVIGKLSGTSEKKNGNK